MTTEGVRIESRTFLMPDLGRENPYPLLSAPLENPYRLTGDIPAEILEGSRFGHPPNLYPYRMRDGYDRELAERELDTIVLENERLRAIVLPGLGGRLWELHDKRSGKNLLHSPRAIRFANLALRNAWFAGGIEWNIGTRGHSPLTCEPLHAGLVRSGGVDGLRLWEFERMRGVVFQVDAWLPPDSPVLLVAIRIRNPNTAAVPMYWWSNAAVPQSDGDRVLVPADTAFAGDYAGGIVRVDPTAVDGVDGTRPAANPRARDYFFDIRPRQRPWILHTDRAGDGLAMLSGRRLRGRKLFVWGHGPGGRRWQEWLGGPGAEYAEIQAGLAQTQYQHLWMPAGAEWSWVEAYGNPRVDPAVAHGDDWAAAVRHGGERVEALWSTEELAELEASAGARADRPPERLLSAGSGWGALEAARRRAAGMPWVDESPTPFPEESLTDEQAPWLDVLAGTGFSGAPSDVAGADWKERLAADTGTAGLVHRAVLVHAHGDLAEAERLYRQSMEHSLSLGPRRRFRTRRSIGRPCRWGAKGTALSGQLASTGSASVEALALRGLALLALAAGRPDEAGSHYRAACDRAPDDRSLLVEAAAGLIAADRAEDALDLIQGAPPDIAAHGRVRFLRALALARVGHRAEAADILKTGLEVPDLREGENSITALWLEVCPGEPVPPAYRFSMHS